MSNVNISAWNSQTRQEEERRNAGDANGYAQSTAATTFVAKFLLLFTQMLLNEISFDCGICYYGNMASLSNRFSPGHEED